MSTARLWEGVVDEALEREVLGACLDQAPERRRIREAFKDVQLNIDHYLFKVNPFPSLPPIYVSFLWSRDPRATNTPFRASGVWMWASDVKAQLKRLLPIGKSSGFGFYINSPFPISDAKYSGIGTKESYEHNSRGVEIFSKCWFPENHCMKAIVCLCHGYGDTCTFFLEGFARKIASVGYGVFALDYPGFGLSEGLHGYIPSFDALVDGNPEYKGLPSFLFGQSMGGAVALKVHFKQPSEWNGAILVAPMCKIADGVVPLWPVQQVLIVMAKLLPKLKLVPQKDLAELAFREKKKREQTSFNVIAYIDKPRLQTAWEMLKTTRDRNTSGRGIGCFHFQDITSSGHSMVFLPMIILHDEADLVTNPAVSKALYEKAKSQDKKLCLYKDAYHSILEGEPDETIARVIDDIISWLDQHSTKQGSS
ncbi:hypothetical protein U9M48_008320 [Paspalum notatum var. saurae]|uniref:Serine aminopeptidase S33 domain-containing protein n=1 Tax=Paspalum notatum var. saurae TaxID=547442 RepID=A0AAQ3WD75_PASNO